MTRSGRPGVARAPLHGGQLPVLPRDSATACDRSAGAVHRPTRHPGSGGVVASELLSGFDVSPCHEGVRVDIPEVWVATVVAVMNGAWWDDQMQIVLDRDRVDKWPRTVDGCLR